MDIAKTANEKRPEKQRKRKEQEEEQERVDEFYATPVGEKQVIHDTKVEAFEEMPEETKEEVKEETNVTEEVTAPKKRGRPAK